MSGDRSISLALSLLLARVTWWCLVEWSEPVIHVAASSAALILPVAVLVVWGDRERYAATWQVHRACGMRLRTAWVRTGVNVHDGENFDRWEART